MSAVHRSEYWTLVVGYSDYVVSCFFLISPAHMVFDSLHDHLAHPAPNLH